MVRVTRDSWRTPRTLRHSPETTRKAGRYHGPSDKVPSIPGQLVDHAGPREQARVPRDCWSTPQVLGPGPEYPGTAGRTRGPSYTSLIRPGGRVDTSGPCSWVRVTRDSLSTPQALGTRPETHGTFGRPRGHYQYGRSHGASGMGPGRLGQLVNSVTSDQNLSRPVDLVYTAGPRAPARVALDSWSTTRALGIGPESPRTAD